MLYKKWDNQNWVAWDENCLTQSFLCKGSGGVPYKQKLCDSPQKRTSPCPSNKTFTKLIKLASYWKKMIFLRMKQFHDKKIWLNLTYIIWWENGAICKLPIWKTLWLDLAKTCVAFKIACSCVENFSQYYFDASYST